MNNQEKQDFFQETDQFQDIMQLDKASDTVDRDPLGVYLTQISQFPLLTAEQEMEIGKNIVELKAEIKSLSEDAVILPGKRNVLEKKLKDYKNMLIIGNLRLVISIAKKYQHRGLAMLDLIDEGNIGLIEAVERYDYSKGFRFSTYGTWWIRQAIVKAVADKSRVIRIPVHMQNTIKKFSCIVKYATMELGRDPSTEELAEYMNVPQEKLRFIRKINLDTASLDLTVDEENSTKLSDMISDDQFIEPFEEVFNTTIQETIGRAMKVLTGKERQVISLRFGLNGEGPMTLQEAGEIMGITRERVRQIQEKAMMKLRNEELVLDLKDII